MLSNKDIRVENGNLIINGAKYPLDTKEIKEEVDAIDNRVKTLENGAVKSKDVTLEVTTSGHSAPTLSAGGAYYERLADYTTLGVARDNILAFGLVSWGDIKKSFNLYLGTTALSALSDSNDSIYTNDSTANITVRILYTD